MTQGHTYVQWIVAFLADTTLLTFGLQTGWVSPMTSVLQSEESPVGRPLTDQEMSWIASTLPISAMFGVVLYVYIAEKYGRKTAVLAMAIPQALCWIIKLSTTSFASLILARICAGIPAGGCFNLIPMYVKEISQDNIRGMLVSLFALMQNVGLFLMYVMGAYMDYYTVIWAVMAIPLFTIAAFLKAPESPAFLVKVGKFEEAAKTLAYLRGLDVYDKEVQTEIQIMKDEDTYYKELPSITFMSIFKNKPWRSGLFLILLVITMQACNGIFAILTYASTIYSLSGVTLSPELQTMSIPTVMIIGSFMSMGCVEKIGRKTILVITFAVTAVSLVVLAGALLVQFHGGTVPGWLPVAAIVLSVWAYAAGVSPMPYIMMSEMFNFQIRAKILGCIVTYAWFFTFIQLAMFTPISNMLGLHNTFFLYAAINLLGVFITIIIPETKGRTVDQIEDLLR